MPTIYLNEREAGGPAKGIAFPNVRSCVALACVLADGTLVGAHMSKLDDIARVTPRLKRAMGEEAIKRMYLIGGYTAGKSSPNGPMAAHPATMAAALGYTGEVWSYDTGRKHIPSMLVTVDQPDLSGTVRVQYKDWSKLKPIDDAVKPGEKHPYQNLPLPVFTVGVQRLPKGNNPAPALIMHTLPLSKFTVTTV